MRIYDVCFCALCSLLLVRSYCMTSQKAIFGISPSALRSATSLRGERYRNEPSSRIDIHALDVACTEYRERHISRTKQEVSPQIECNHIW